MPKPKIFISYSHKDEEWKDLVVSHLSVLANEGDFDVWVDDQIQAGDDWLPDIERAIDDASAALLLVSVDFLNSNFIRSKEIPRLLERRKTQGMRVIPLIVRPAAWTRVKWLGSIQARPDDGRALSTMEEPEREVALAALTAEIADLLTAAPQSNNCEDGVAELEVAVSRLPITGRDLFGREKELAMLDEAWKDPNTHIVVLVGWGGLGKSSLVSYWRDQLVQEGGRGAAHVFDWSFYNQGTNANSTSADQFISAALDWFGDANPTEGSPWSKGERLAQLVGSRRTLLVLDGLEPLQNPPGFDEGRLRDQSLQSLLRGLADINVGLCIVTTRLSVSDLDRYKTNTVREHSLEHLSPTAGAQILRVQGVVKGTDQELEEASREFGGHPLALTLLGSLLSDAYEGDIRRRSEVAALTQAPKYGGHATRVMNSYSEWLGDGPEIRALRIMGLFDRPAEPDIIEAVLNPPEIPGLTDGMPPAGTAELRQIFTRLRRTGLLSEANSSTSAVIDAHPLVRTYFAHQLQAQFPSAWREGNRRIFEYLSSTTPEYPDSLDAITPLLIAVPHGCRAGEYRTTLQEILFRRIDRGAEDYLIKQFSAYGAELSAFSHFFEVPWSRPVVELTDEDKMWLTGSTAFILFRVGRTSEAIDSNQTGLSYAVDLEDWGNASRICSNLVEIFVSTGPLSTALEFADRTIGYAELTSNLYLKSIGFAFRGKALHMMGKIAEAETAFAEAVRLQQEFQPEYPFLYSHRSYSYCDFLLTLGRNDEAITAAERDLKLASSRNRPLDRALAHLILGRAFLQEEKKQPGTTLLQAAKELNITLEEIRRDGSPNNLVLALLSRAELHEITDNAVSWQKDLHEALDVAESSRMHVYETDCQLGLTRFYLAAGNRDAAATALNRAKQLVGETKFELRKTSLEDLSGVLE